MLLTLTIGALAPAQIHAAEGERLARQWCASCHVIGETETGTVPQGPPTLRSVARSGMTAEQLRAFLINPHGAMPNLSLTRSEIDELITYISTLR
jgi:mono/diheme cytochrome c family protein